MRKPLISVSLGSLCCWGVSILFLFIGSDQAARQGIFVTGFALLLLGVLLLLCASCLFILRGFLLDRDFASQGIPFHYRDLFRKREHANPYQREVWLKGSIMLALPLMLLIGLSVRAVSGEHFLLLPANEYWQQTTERNLSVVPLAGVAFPLCMLFYAVASKDVVQVSSDKETDVDSISSGSQ